MSDELIRTVISPPGAAIREVRIDLPKVLREAISESLDRGRRASRQEQPAPEERKTTPSASEG
jgi:hypothetical protein